MTDEVKYYAGREGALKRVYPQPARKQNLLDKIIKWFDDIDFDPAKRR